MTKWLVILAGPNGAGKSTLVSSGAIHLSVGPSADASFEVLNPDERAKALAAGEGVTTALNLQAVKEVEAELYEAVRHGRSAGVETVLSSPKFRALVDRAKDAGYKFMLHYVVLADPDLHAGRVGQRVQEGGHDVDRQKITERYFRSLEEMPWFAARADEVYVWDNSGIGAPPVLLAQKNPEDGWQTFDGPHVLHAKVQAAIGRAVANTESQ